MKTEFRARQTLSKAAGKGLFRAECKTGPVALRSAMLLNSNAHTQKDRHTLYN